MEMDKRSRCALRPLARREAGRKTRIQNGPINSRLGISQAALSHPVLMQQQVLAQKQHNWICSECLLKGLPVVSCCSLKALFFGKPCKSLISWRCIKRWKRWELKALALFGRQRWSLIGPLWMWQTWGLPIRHLLGWASPTEVFTGLFSVWYVK